MEMYQFIERDMRGGVIYIAQMSSEANNKYMISYDKGKASKCIIYEDSNNFYGCAMFQYLPFGGFNWLTQDKIYRLDMCTIHKDNL